MNTHLQDVVDYYNNPESKLGYTFLTWDTKHFGYYPEKRRSITEKSAQTLMMDLLAKKLKLSSANLILDAGCGRGTTSCYLARKYRSSITGIDIVPFEISIAKRRATQLNLLRKVSFYSRDYSDTKFPANHFDKVFTLETLVHSPNVEKTLDEFNRILKPGGRLVLFEYSMSLLDEFSMWEREMIEIIIKGSVMTSLPRLGHDAFTKFIAKAGYRILSDDDITENVEPSLQRFNNYAIIPYQFIKLFHLQKHFINTTAGVEFYKLIKKRLIRYRVFVAEKQV